MKWMQVLTVVALCTVMFGADEALKRDVRVTSVSGNSVFLDAGRDLGIEPGATVVLFLPEGGQVEVIVRDVSANNARAELPAGAEIPTIGTRGELYVAPPDPDEYDQETKGTYGPDSESTPEHPPWVRQEGQRDEDMPLLAPAFATQLKERPMDIHGRLFTDHRFTHDGGGSRSNNFYIGRVGAWLEVTNPFKQGGRLLFSGDLDYRGADSSFDSESDVRVRVDRLSYAIGGQEYSPYRVELGRFYSTYLPEIGLVDGAEGTLRFKNGWEIGAALGSFPVAFPERDTGEDFGFYLFANYVSEAAHQLRGTIAYQQTWHQGAPDRNLLLGRISARPLPWLWVFSRARIDIYGPSDDLKSGSAGLTEFFLQTRFTPGPDWGGSLSYIHTTWPQLRRKEFDRLPDRLVSDGHVDRITASSWYRLSKIVRVSGRANYWLDQDNNGYGLQFGTDLKNLWDDSSNLHAAIYYNSAAFTDGIGFRLRARETIDSWRFSLGYEVFHYTSSGSIGANRSFTRHTFTGDVSWTYGSWYYGVNGSYHFGQDENAISLGIIAEYRF